MEFHELRDSARNLAQELGVQRDLLTETIKCLRAIARWAEIRALSDTRATTIPDLSNAASEVIRRSQELVGTPKKSSSKRGGGKKRKTTTHRTPPEAAVVVQAVLE